MPRKKHDMTSSQKTTKAVPTAPSSSPHIKTKHGQSLSVADSQIDKNKTKKTSQEMKTLDKSHKNGDEIDDLFGALKHTKKRETPSFSGKQQEQRKSEVSREEKAQRNNKKKIVGSKDDIFGEHVDQGRKKTEEGYNIYTEDELGWGKKGGNTDLCPFDCDCCF